MNCESSVQLHVIRKPKAAAVKRMRAEIYLLACQRYIELNPVRACMGAESGQYRWSSYRANGLGQGEGERKVAYRMLFRSELEAEAIDDIRKARR